MSKVGRFLTSIVTCQTYIHITQLVLDNEFSGGFQSQAEKAEFVFKYWKISTRDLLLSNCGIFLNFWFLEFVVVFFFLIAYVYEKNVYFK